MLKSPPDEAQKLQFASVRIVRLLEKFGGLAAGKAMMKLVGIDCGPLRTPLKIVDSEALKSELVKAGLWDSVSHAP